MFAEYATALRRSLIAIDLAVVGGSFLVAYFLRDHVGAGELRPLGHYAWLLVAALVIWSACLRAFGFYRSARYRGRIEVLAQLAKAHALGALVLLSVLFIARRWEISRLLTQLFLAMSFVALAAEKLALLTVLRRLRARGRNFRRALIVGGVDRATRYLELLRDHPYWGIRAIGVADDGGSEDRREVAGCPIVGRIKDLPEIITVRPTDEVIFTIGPREFPGVEEYLDLCQEMGVTSRVVLDVPHRAWTTQQVDWVDGIGILSLEPVHRSPTALAVKRGIDIVGAIAGLLLFGLAALRYAPRIRRESWGPILFRQVRVGRNGRLFTLYKLRTMLVDAEARRAELQTENEMQGHVFKLREDPRVTPTGRYLRAYHLDELPQFWNVLRGDMSLVGTRPPTVEEVECYRPHHRRRLSMKPGVTGLWQLAGNGSVRDFEEIVRLDCQYIDSWSVWLDVSILVRTVVKVLRRTGW